MKLEKHLVLNKYFLNLFDLDNFNDLREKLQDTEEGYDTQNRSYFVDALIGLNPALENELLQYDKSIRKYVKRLRHNRMQPNFNLKYFQYLAVLFTEMFLDNYYNNRQRFLNNINVFLKKLNSKSETGIDTFTEKDLKKLAFWMATGSGKTLIMHINYWQILKYSRDNWNNIILITPNEGLSRQHCQELKLSGIPCKLYEGDIDDLKTRDKEVLIIDIYKLTKEKKGAGVSVDISYFDGKNLVFIDEGHKGQKSEEQTWKKLRDEIGKNGFIFEYSATFGQVIGNNKDLLEEYAKAIIFDYSYKYFYTDGYGKDFYVYNIKAKKQGKKEVYSKEQQSLLLTAGLLSFYEQLSIFEQQEEDFKKYNIEKPLWIFAGSKVTGKGLNSDVVRVIQFLDKITKDENYLKENIEKILNGNSGLIDEEGNDIFKGKFEFVKKFDTNTIAENIYRQVFNGKGKLELYEIKNADGELGLKTSTADKYFGVINVGDVRTLKKLIASLDLEVKDDHFSQSLFFGIDKNISPVNILIGSKKFVEGWNSWRVSNMGLINMGKGEGPQIIQLFGRGVRFKGKQYSLKREENPDYKLNVLQTLFVFGLNADYMNAFLTAIENEEVNYEEITIPIKFNQPKKWERNIYIIKTRDDFNFLDHPAKLALDRQVLEGVKIDLRPKITVAHGLETSTAEAVLDEPLTIPTEYFDTIDWNYIYSEAVDYKITKGMYNLILDTNTVMQVIKSNAYNVFLNETEGLSIEKDNGKPLLQIKSFKGLKKFHEIILMVLKDYILKFYSQAEKRKTMNYLEVEPLTAKHSSMYPEDKQIILKIPRDTAKENIAKEIEEISKQIEGYKAGSGLPDKWKNWDGYIIHFDNHLYTPLIIWEKNKKKVRSVPVKLNEGETEFIKAFKNFLDLKENKHKLKDSEVFLLRNLSKKGIGFFLSSGFYPDFIIWVRKGNSQHMIFVDPKGIRNLGNFNDDKIQLCVFYIKDIEKEVNKELREKEKHVNLQLDAFILSVSKYNKIKETWDNGRFKNVNFKNAEAEFEKNNVIFQDDDKYLEKIFHKVGMM